MAPLPVVRRNTIPTVYDRFAVRDAMWAKEMGPAAVWFNIGVTGFDAAFAVLPPPPPPASPSKTRWLFDVALPIAIWMLLGVGPVILWFCVLRAGEVLARLLSHSKARYLWAVFWAWIGTSAVYMMLKPSKEEVWPPGFYDLVDCTYMVSFDGAKELDLFANQRAVFYDKSVKENGKYRTVEGNWTFYEATKLYSVILNGEVTTYAIAKTTDICILVKGDLGAADLRGSWFSSVSQ
jgi:hypothetical protein